MDRDIVFVLDRLSEKLDCFLVLLLNSNNSFCCIGYLHAVFQSADCNICFLFNLLDIVAKSRFAFCSIYQDIPAVKVRSNLHASWESCAAHTYDSGFLNHLKLAAFLNRYKLIFLLFIRLDDDSVFQDLFHHAVDAGKDVSAKSCRSCNQGTFFYLIPNLYDCLTGCTNMLT